MPENYREAIDCPECSDWQSAMNAEISALQEADAYTLVPLPKGQHVIGSIDGYLIFVQALIMYQNLKLGSVHAVSYKRKMNIAKHLHQLPS